LELAVDMNEEPEQATTPGQLWHRSWCFSPSFTASGTRLLQRRAGSSQQKIEKTTTLLRKQLLSEQTFTTSSWTFLKVELQLGRLLGSAKRLALA
jgi:hypothetical protein